MVFHQRTNAANSVQAGNSFEQPDKPRKNKLKTRFLSQTALFALLATSLPTYADVVGGFPGRTVYAAENNGTAAEAFYKSYEDGSAPGIRLSHRYNADILVFADAIQLTQEGDELGSRDDFDGTVFGVGAMYFKPDLLEGYDAAFSASYHTGEISTGRTDVDFPGTNLRIENWELNSDVTEIALQLIISSRKPLAANGLQWYAGVGVHRLEIDPSVNGGVVNVNTPDGSQINLNQAIADSGTSETEFGATAGVVLPTSFGHMYAAAESIDGTILGVGVRYNLK